jgi:hypothetical protein
MGRRGPHLNLGWPGAVGGAVGVKLPACRRRMRIGGDGRDNDGSFKREVEEDATVHRTAYSFLCEFTDVNSMLQSTCRVMF